MTDFPPFSQLLSRATVQALQMRCLTFSRVNWLRNGESPKAGESIWRTLYVIDIYILFGCHFYACSRFTKYRLLHPNENILKGFLIRQLSWPFFINIPSLFKLLLSKRNFL